MSINRNNTSKNSYKSVISKAVKANLGKQSAPPEEIFIEGFEFKTLDDVICEIKQLSLNIESDIVKVVSFKNNIQNIDAKLNIENSGHDRQSIMKIHALRSRYTLQIDRLEDNIFSNDSKRKYLFNKVSPDKIALFEILNQGIDTARREMLSSNYTTKLLKDEITNLENNLNFSDSKEAKKEIQAKLREKKGEIKNLVQEYENLSTNFNILIIKRDELLKTIK